MKPIVQIFAFLLLAGVAFSSPFEKRQSNPTIPSGCVTITIPITATSNDNIPLPSGLNQLNFLLLVNPLLVGAIDTVASGTYNIGATYCPGFGSRAQTLQILIHGGTYTRSYWFGLYYSQSNSWVDYASSLGYATLSIDRLGNGLSDHPDPIVDVQLPYQTEELHQIILLARAGLIPETNTNFTRIIVVGHSLGSVVANCLNAKYPADADATLLTGYALFFPPQFTGVFIQSWLLPADLSDPRYADLSPGYLELNNLNYISFLFYDPGQFSQSLQDVDFNNRGTVSLGEASGILAGSLQTAYTGPVLVITGLHDSIYCSTFTIDIQILFGTPLCDTSLNGIVRQASTLYPYASSFEVVFPNAGHCWQLHNNATVTFGIAHEWLAAQGF